MSVTPLAQKLNEQIEQAAPPVAQMLSALGRRIYFPKGILSQSAEAKSKAHRFNATIGIATEGDDPMHLPSIHSQLSGVSPADAYSYAPPGGRPDASRTSRACSEHTHERCGLRSRAIRRG